MFFDGFCYLVEVSQIDLDSATGNTIYNNNTVYFNDFYVYPGTLQTFEYTTNGSKCLCGNLEPTTELVYYQDDIKITSTVSTYSGGIDPCTINPLSCCNQFEVQLCLTDEGSTTLGSTLEVYSNPISLIDFGTYIQNVLKTDITGLNCPYTIIVPDTTTTIRLYDPISNCYVDFIVGQNNVCQTCNLTLDTASNNLTGVINTGILTGNCDSNITSYRIVWYGPDSNTNIAFKSGKGTDFPDYTVEHPITNVNSPSLLPGTYVSRLTDVELNGIKYSYSGGTGTGLVLSELRGCSLFFTVV